MRTEDLSNIERLEDYYQKKQREYFQKIANASTYDEAKPIINKWFNWKVANVLKTSNPFLLQLYLTDSLQERELCKW
ncbi:hypothetical protein COX97_02210 [Candidatus Pacearchaeota archaeon CG_4_10_14_0_2_um_filter_05_32_18]|nr:MAG: hypothetical protein AUJ62_02225 [Candidatus Pacearchaeota archaeon CG1_02_32_21]PIZ82948.1 MAG: hypothetical protein COX97_02210 [Candidatus Pacearchaeota archaeon CG_4_10_14_0_2_um_filter_05_32_18]